MSEQENHEDNAGIITHPPFFYVGFVILALVFDYFYPLEIGYINITKPAAIIILVIGIFIMIAAGKMFRSDKQDVSVHTKTENIYQSGIYAYSRNPLYLALTMIALAGGLYFDKLWILISLIPVLYIMNKMVIAKEEAYLERKFGDEYRAYKEKVRRWI